jgi:hypothetical protein
MSNALALAGVTAVLKDLLDNAVVDESITGAMGGPVTVSTLPPDRIETGENEQARLNLFLYHVTPNAALSNSALPARDDRGHRLSNPPLALDLFYMLSAYSADDFEAEILLGYGMLTLHERPVLSREAIRRALAVPSPVDGGILPPAVGALVASDLAEQLELVKVTPHALSTEETSKLWTAFQAKYRPSASYVATVVLIAADQPTRGALPVLSRGPVDPASRTERGVVAQPSLAPPFPALESALPPASQPALRMGELLTLLGRNLAGASVGVSFVHVRSGHQHELPVETGASATRLGVRLPPDPPAEALEAESSLNPTNWPAGVYAVAAIVRRTGQPERTSNALPLLLAPRLRNISASAAGDGKSTIELTVSPPVHPNQRVRLLVGSVDAPPEPLGDEPTSTLQVTSEFPSGEQWLQLRVDEAESLLVDRSVVPPRFDPSQQVNIP